MPRRSARSVTRAFFFSDLRGYTAYVERAGDTAATRLLRTYRDLVRREVAREEGGEIKTEGDSFYVVFSSAAGAVRCAMAVQRAARRRMEPLAIGIGIHAGEALPFDEQFVGGAVNLAARLASAADAGEILISETAYGLVRTAVRAPLEDRGLLTLKGVAEPIRAHGIKIGQAPRAPQPAGPATRPMEAVLRGNLEEASRLARALLAEPAITVRCEALVALTMITAARGDLESALARTEQLLPVAHRAPDTSWARTTYALRSWLYFLARQPAEAQAELDRALERPGATPAACLLTLLAVTANPLPSHVEPVRHLGQACVEPPLSIACKTVADVLEGRVDSRSAVDAVILAGAPFIAALLELQFTARAGGSPGPSQQTGAGRPGVGRLGEMIFQAVQ